jgi:hypothetical protein
MVCMHCCCCWCCCCCCWCCCCCCRTRASSMPTQSSGTGAPDSKQQSCGTLNVADICAYTSHRLAAIMVMPALSDLIML